MPIKEINSKDGKKIFDVQVSKRHPITRKRQFLRRRVTSKYEARQVEIQLHNELDEIFKGNKVPAWLELLSSYEQNCLVNKAASTRHNELSIFRYHATPVLQMKTLDEIFESDIRLILQRVDPERSLNLKHNIKKCLSNIFNYAIECRYITENPCRRIKLEKIPEPVLNCLTDAQIRLFLERAEHSESEWFPIWAFAIYTGMRSGELIALRWKHIEHSEGKPIIKVQESWTKQGGYKPYTKNKQVRTVPINEPLQRIIDSLKEKRISNNFDDFVLPQSATWKQGDAAKELSSFLKGCSLPAIRFHDLRACFITQCLLRDVPPLVVMRMAGHATLKVTMRYCRLVGSDVLGHTDVLNFSPLK